MLRTGQHCASCIPVYSRHSLELFLLCFRLLLSVCVARPVFRQCQEAGELNFHVRRGANGRVATDTQESATARWIDLFTGEKMLRLPHPLNPLDLWIDAAC